MRACFGRPPRLRVYRQVALPGVARLAAASQSLERERAIEQRLCGTLLAAGAIERREGAPVIRGSVLLPAAGDVRGGQIHLHVTVGMRQRGRAFQRANRPVDIARQYLRVTEG